MRERLSYEDHISGIKAGDINILSRAITLVESRKSEDVELAVKLVDALMPLTGNSIRVGITGSPGVGKSTFIGQFGKLLLKKKHKLAVLAIDPSSEQTQGSILGDKTRMSELLQLENVFVRPSPTGGNLGGVARKTREAMLLCEAAGFDFIIVETVGTGQSETTVKNMVDFLLLLLPPLGGDELQGIKKGIVETADSIVVTKADGQNIKAAKDAVNEYRTALKILNKYSNTPVISVSSIEHTGFDEVYNTLTNYLKESKKDNQLLIKREGQLINWMHEELKFQLTHTFYTDKKNQALLAQFEEEIRQKRLSPHSAVHKLTS